MKLSFSPCFGCTERYVHYTDEGKAVSCHSVCQRHADYLSSLALVRKKKTERAQADCFYHDMAERVRKSTRFYKKNK